MSSFCSRIHVTDYALFNIYVLKLYIIFVLRSTSPMRKIKKSLLGKPLDTLASTIGNGNEANEPKGQRVETAGW